MEKDIRIQHYDRVYDKIYFLVVKGKETYEIQVTRMILNKMLDKKNSARFLKELGTQDKEVLELVIKKGGVKWIESECEKTIVL